MHLEVVREHKLVSITLFKELFCKVQKKTAARAINFGLVNIHRGNFFFFQSQGLLLRTGTHCNCTVFVTKYSRMDQVKFVKDSL